MEIPRIKYNDSDDTLYCTGCKRIIEYGTKYVTLIDDYDDSEKTYHLDCCPADEE